MTFKTERLQVAVFLHASKRLQLLRCEQSQPGKVRFVFDDPDDLGSEYEFLFDSGTAVPATDIFASQKYLRRMMTQKLNQENIGTRNDIRHAAVAAR